VPKKEYKNLPEEKKIIDEAELIEYEKFANCLRDVGYVPIMTELYDVEGGLRKEMTTIRDLYPLDSFEHMTYDVRQSTMKTFMASAYGALVFPYSPLADDFLSPATAHVSRDEALIVRDVLKELGWEPFYGDTDSAFFKLMFNSPELFIAVIHQVEDELRTRMAKKYGIAEKDVQVGFEPKWIMKTLFLVSSKHYKGFANWVEGIPLEKPRMIIAGLEEKRSGNFKLLKEIDDTVTNMVNDGRRAEVPSYIAKLFAEMDEGKLDSKLVFSMRVDKGLDRYKNTNLPQLRAVKGLAGTGSFRVGDTVRWVIVGGKDTETPLIGDKIPKILKDGYDYYKSRVIGLMKNLGLIRVDGKGKKKQTMWSDNNEKVQP
jgi:DNA polymerase elongation subunit (family B)